MDESVIFEIQVEQKVLEQVFKENQHLKESYKKLLEADNSIRPLKEEIEELKSKLKKLENLNTELCEESLELKQIIKELTLSNRIVEQKKNMDNLEQTEGKLLKIKLEAAEKEKLTLIEKFEEERKLLEVLNQDKTKLQEKQVKLEKSKQRLAEVGKELKETKRILNKIKAENHELDKEKLDLEIKLKESVNIIKLLQSKDTLSDLEHAESKLLKLKLERVENEKKYILEEFERERKIMNQQSKPRVALIEENIHHLRKWIEKESKRRHPHDSAEVKSLKEQIHTLETDKTNLIEGFELERKVFQKILKGNMHFHSP